MKPRHLIIFFVLLLGCALWFRSQTKAVTPVAEEPAAPIPSQANPAAAAQQQSAFDAANQARSPQLTQPAREQLRMVHQAAWAALISTNQQTYLKLLHEAVHSKNGKVPCTICGGKGDLDFCIVCGGTGKCPTCHGTGKVAHDDCCPTCLGTGKCYFCNGSGKMACPFCDDGIISAKAQPPPEAMPLNL